MKTPKPESLPDRNSTVLKSWSEFKSYVESLLPKTREFHAIDARISRPLFRGHGENKWKLESTLERYGYPELPLAHYMQTCGSIRRLCGNFEPSSIEFNERISTKYKDLKPFPNYEYLGFLRHHGLPSPLLDWTESPYVAAFFAFRDKPAPDTNAVRVCVYRPYYGHGRSFLSDEPHLQVLGPFATIHRRHATQQCWYSVAIKEANDECILCSHEAAIAAQQNTDLPQDVVEFIDIKIDQREEALADLSHMNITAYTLFNTLDALVETSLARVFERG